MHDVAGNRVIHPLVREAFRALDVAGIVWCLLHDEENLALAVHDIDLLVAEDDMPRIDRVLAQAGFVRLDGLGRGAHAVFGAFSAPEDTFAVVDVTFELSYGPSGNFVFNWLRPRLETGVARACCARRVRAGEYWLLSAPDEFWALLLNCIVDKRDVPARHRRRLRELAPHALAGPLESAMIPLLPADSSTACVVEAVVQSRFDDLVDIGSTIVQRASAQRSVRRRVSAFTIGARRLRRDLRDVARGRTGGLSVALLGPDGAGKSSTAESIAASWPVDTRTVYMGLWSRDDDGRVWAQLRELPLRPWRVWWRYARGLRWRLVGSLVLFDRYTYDALAPVAPPLARLKRAYFAMISHACPAPDLVVVLDAPAEMMHARKPDKEVEELIELRRAYRVIGRRVRDAHLVDASREPNAVCAQVRALVWGAYARKRAEAR